jgi:hypothetical protein
MNGEILPEPVYAPNPNAPHQGYEDYQGQHGDEWVPAEPKIPLEELITSLLDTQHLEAERDILQMMKDLHILECLKEAAPEAGMIMIQAVENKINSLNTDIRLAHEQNHIKSVQAGWHETNQRNGALSTPSGIAHPNPQNPNQWNFQYTQGTQYQQPWGPSPQQHHTVKEFGKGLFTQFVKNKTGVDLNTPPPPPGPFGAPPVQPGYYPPPAPPPGYYPPRQQW